MKYFTFLKGILLIISLTLLQTSCVSDTPSVPPALVDTTKAATTALDSQLTTPTPEIKKVKCQEVEKSTFRTLGCCAEICDSENLELKEPDCCCAEVLNAYEQIYKANTLKKNSMDEVAKIKNDLIFSICKRKYRQKVQEIENRYKRKIADSTEINKSKFE